MQPFWILKWELLYFYLEKEKKNLKKKSYKKPANQLPSQSNRRERCGDSFPVTADRAAGPGSGACRGGGGSGNPCLWWRCQLPQPHLVPSAGGVVSHGAPSVPSFRASSVLAFKPGSSPNSLLKFLSFFFFFFWKKSQTNSLRNGAGFIFPVQFKEMGIFHTTVQPSLWN